MLRAAPRRAGLSRDTIIGVAAVGIILIGWYVVALGIRDSAMMERKVPEFGRNIASGLFIAAAVARLASWHLVRDRDAAKVAVVLLLVGASLPCAALLTTAVHDGAVARIEAPEGDVIVFVPLCLLALFLGRRNRRRLITTGLIIIGSACVTVALAAVLPGAPAADQHLTVLWVGVEAMTVAGWAALAYLTWTRRRPGEESAVLSWAVFAVVLMALRAIVRLCSLLDASALHGLGGGPDLCAAGIMLANTVRVLYSQIRQRVIDDELGQLLLLRSARAEELERAHRARLHDARSVVLGVKGASSLLARNTTLPVDLDAMLAAELDRLHALLDTAPPPSVEFDVRDALLPVLTTHRLGGAKIHDCFEPARAVGSPTDTATVVDNLLRNAARHAPGAEIRVDVRRIGAGVQIVVEDDGPGIAVEDRARMVLPGVRGPGAPVGGQGLGLYNSLCAMSAQHGSLRIEGRRHGGIRIVLELPVATPARIAG